MLEGFVEGGKYVVEEELLGGRLLCHDLGAEGNKRIIPFGSRVMNRLYTKGSGKEIVMYDGMKVQVYNRSILTCRRDSEGVYFEGLFFIYPDCSEFNEGCIYYYGGVDNDGNILLLDKQMGRCKVMPKGVVLSYDVYSNWVYNGRNTKFPEKGSEILCSSIRDDMVFVGAFERSDDTEVEGGVFKCPNCGFDCEESNYSTVKLSAYKSLSDKSSDCINKYSKYKCSACNCTILRQREGLGAVYTIVDVLD